MFYTKVHIYSPLTKPEYEKKCYLAALFKQI